MLKEIGYAVLGLALGTCVYFGLVAAGIIH